MSEHYQISPSTLKNFNPANRFRCERCAWLKIKHNVRPPESRGLGAFLRDIHEWFFAELQSNPDKFAGIVPQGKLIETELHVTSKPYHGIQLHGYIDGLMELENGGYCLIDLKTTQKTKWIVKNYALQVCCYHAALVAPADGAPSYAPIECMGLLAFVGERFGVNHPGTAGVVGALQWHAVRYNRRLVIDAVNRAANLLASDTPPDGNPNCEWCAFYEKWGMELPRGMKR